MLSLLDSAFGFSAFMSLVGAAIDDLDRMEIHPFFYKFAFVLTIVAALSSGMSIVNIVYVGCVWFVIGFILYKIGVWGGGDAKLMLAVGAYVTYLGITPLVYAMVLVFTVFCASVVWALWNVLNKGSVGGRVPFAPAFPLSVVLTVFLLRHFGF